ncbi:MAG: SDR family oxidoreductase [Pseudonocardia sp.]|nr:SDR family oxidoreductase [Pseudonocardia sp.]
MSVAVVTGGSAGVGRAVVRALASKGWDVGVLARGQAGLDGAVADVERCGRRALAVETDVADFGQVERAAAAVETELGPIDLWINDAMTTVFAPSWDVSPDDFKRAVEVTFLGQVWGTQVALARMRPRNRGSIVNVGSALAFIGIPLQSAYCASKFASRGYFESVRAELIHQGSAVRLSMVHLPAVNTPQFDWCETTLDKHPKPVPPTYQPEVAADRIVKIALNGRRASVLGAWNRILVVAGSLLPGYGNQYAALGAWESQLTDQPLRPDRRSNLRAPVDDTSDHGAKGEFGKTAKGMADPGFLRSLPTTAATVVRAAGRTARDRYQRPRR